ncbi:damage-control phosphatase ARMT1 family protein [Yinghuangia aomiensis]|uniref:Damage-control phosphatase ARMT1 family protein n=2 Tax=Yinghuangia aomiensis TaxID=676205 RepID=A0ABP9GXA4_9ACTN
MRRMAHARRDLSDDGGLAPEIGWSEPGSFGWGVFHERHPRLVRQLREDLPLGAGQAEALDALVAETLGGVVAPMGADAVEWEGWGQGRFGRPWREASFLWAESCFYRRLLEAVGYFGTGAWRGVDPFGPAKEAELQGSVVDEELAALDGLGDADVDEAQRRDALLAASLWGNRADLGFLMTAGGAGASGDSAGHGLVADDRAQLWAHLERRRGGLVIVVADNAGRELLPDLVLVDHLLRGGLAAQVVLHVKPQPYYVSDATTDDVVAALRRLRGAGTEAAAQVGRRLWECAAEGLLVVRAHPFACAPSAYTGMPEDLAAEFAGAALTVLKGDLNYRRLVQDRHWPATLPFAEATAYFPGPVASLRTLKSEVVVGLEPGTVRRMDAAGAPWRTAGTHALVQFRS